MPQLDTQLPLPNLNLYAGFSGLAFFYAVVYALTSSQENFICMVWSDVCCTAAVLNMACCCFFLLAKFVHSLVFGSLQSMEHQHMRDKFWNFTFYKFIFVFGVMNVQEMPEMLCWCVWFAILGTLLLTEQLCRDRFQFLSFSPNTSGSSHAKIILLLSVILLSCAGLFMVCAVVGWQYGFNHFTFLFSEVFILFASALHSVIRYIIHLWDMHHEGVWENRNTYTYYTELVLEVAVLCVDFMHHIHMLLWANMFLSVASLILLMKLRFLYQEIQRRLRRHRNYILVSETLEKRFVQVPAHELLITDETCAICWEKMNAAIRLPCRHIFHRVCLRGWLEQDTVCPTCRFSLSEDLRQGGQPNRQGQVIEEERGRGRRFRRNMRNARNWLLRFNGASIASWLPTFSLELHQEDGQRWISDAADVHRVAQQIHNMFPYVPLHAITLDLADTHSVSLTVDRILNNIIYIPGERGVHMPEQIEGGDDTPPQPPEENNEEQITPGGERQEIPLPQQNFSSSVVPQDNSQDTDITEHQQSCDLNELQESHDLDEGSMEEIQSIHSGVRSRKKHSETISLAVPVQSNISKDCPSEGSGHPSSATPTTSNDAYSQMFSFLQEKKAELIRKAKSRYLLKDHSNDDHRT